MPTIPMKGSAGTVLVVNEDQAVLETVVAILKDANFRVLSAPSVNAALKIAGETEDKIDLLLAHVDLPGMSGPDLGQELKKTRTDIHVMLIAGGKQGNLLVLNYGWAYINKALVSAKLVQMVTEVLHSRDRSQLGGQEFDSRKDKP
jgi:DNA-binding response OmpR family regulator